MTERDRSSCLLLFVLLATAVLGLRCAHADPVDAAPRIVSLAPHLTELAFAAGAQDRLVGVVEWSDFPEAAKSLPRIGDAFRFDTEAILALGATDALTWVGGTPPAAIEQLRGLGIEIHALETGTLDQIAEAAESIGALAGSGPTAEAAADRYRARLEQLRTRRSSGTSIRVFYQVSHRPLFTLAGRHVINEILALCGAQNVFADLDREAASVGIEAVLAAAPDAILVGADSEREAIRNLWNRYPDLSAVNCDRVHGVDADRLVRPTLRILDGAESLCDWLNGVRSAARSDPDPACRLAGD